jgi:hypothetical protein
MFSHKLFTMPLGDLTNKLKINGALKKILPEAPVPIKASAITPLLLLHHLRLVRRSLFLN